MTEVVYKMLEDALDIGISEFDFWEMTIAELGRASKSRARMLKRQAQEKATYDYIQAQLIVKGVAKVLGDKSAYPTLEEVYGSLFDDVIAEREAKRQEQLIQLSAIRFKQYANFHNKKYEEVAKEQ